MAIVVALLQLSLFYLIQHNPDQILMLKFERGFLRRLIIGLSSSDDEKHAFTQTCQIAGIVNRQRWWGIPELTQSNAVVTRSRSSFMRPLRSNSLGFETLVPHGMKQRLLSGLFWITAYSSACPANNRLVLQGARRSQSVVLLRRAKIGIDQ